MLKFCNSPWTTVNIQRDGSVTMCLCPGWSKHSPIGNLNSQSLQEIFESNAVLGFRESIYDQSFKFCNDNFCGQWWNRSEVENFEHVVTRSLPTNIYLQNLDLSCNLSCESCRNDFYFSKDVDPVADLILSKIIDEYQGFDHEVRIQADGAGEMLMSTAYQKFLRSDNFPECFKLHINSNGTLLSKNIDLITKLRNQFAGISVSVDASTPETYKKVRGGNFSVVLDGIRQVVDLGIPVVTQFVVQQKNYHEILSYIELSKSLGVTFNHFGGITRWPHMSDDWWDKNRITGNPYIDYKWLVSALAEIKKLDNCGMNGVLAKILNDGGSPQVFEPKDSGIMWIYKNKIQNPNV